MTVMHQYISVLMILALAVTPGLVKAQQPFVHANDIQFSIGTDRDAYHIGDQIVIHYTIKNVSNGALYVPARQWEIKCGTLPHLWSRLEDSGGHRYEWGFSGSCLNPNPIDKMTLRERMQKDAVLLKPGQVAAGFSSFDSKMYGKFALQPGVYRLEAVLYGWNLRPDDAQLSELAGMGAPFLIGESTATSHIELCSGGK